VIGGGFIGLEVASTFAQQNKRVTVVEATDRVLARVSSPEISAFFTSVHTQNGVKFIHGQPVERLTGEDGRVREVQLADGLVLKADLVVVGIGSIAHLDLARQLGLETDSGIVVDRHSRTSLDGVLAAGDCASHRSALNPGGIRLESVQNAIDQARVAGASVAGGDASYDALPWFWSDQYDYKLQVAGLAAGATERLLREGSGREMSVFHFRNDTCICLESVNRPREHIAARRLLPRGITKQQLRAAEFDTAALLKQLAD
jgi:3-phenylpropionate/trans-cinnamate dioxygenase ferredoxin reductase subunit